MREFKVIAVDSPKKTTPLNTKANERMRTADSAQKLDFGNFKKVPIKGNEATLNLQKGQGLEDSLDDAPEPKPAEPEDDPYVDDQFEPDSASDEGDFQDRTDFETGDSLMFSSGLAKASLSRFR